MSFSCNFLVQFLGKGFSKSKLKIKKKSKTHIKNLASKIKLQTPNQEKKIVTDMKGKMLSLICEELIQKNTEIYFRKILQEQSSLREEMQIAN